MREVIAGADDLTAVHVDIVADLVERALKTDNITLAVSRLVSIIIQFYSVNLVQHFKFREVYVRSLQSVRGF